MRTAILGWGSLIWDPRSLQIDTSTGKAGWLDDGPLLPIEFARISSDGRLTLVIVSESEYDIRTLYAISKYSELDEAILDLAIREGCGKNKIGVYRKDLNQFSENFKSKNLKASIVGWITNTSIDAVIWTNLSANHKEKLNLDKFTPLNAINYLKNLSSDIQAKAEEYIRKSPDVIDTPIRREVEEKLRWKKINP